MATSVPVPDMDFLFAMTTDSDGNLYGGFALDSSQDLAAVAGADRLDQDIWLEVMSALGSNALLPSQGSTANRLIGTISKNPVADYTAMFTDVEQRLVARHGADVDVGERSKDSALAYFGDVKVSANPAKQTVVVHYVYASLSGVTTSRQLSFTQGS